jgi:hypothetical protein
MYVCMTLYVGNSIYIYKLSMLLCSHDSFCILSLSFVQDVRQLCLWHKTAERSSPLVDDGKFSSFWWPHCCVCAHSCFRCMHLGESSHRFEGIGMEIYLGLHGEWLTKTAMGSIVDSQVNSQVKTLKGLLAEPWG